MGVAAFLVYTGHDHKAPKITIEDQEVSYTEGENTMSC